MRPIAHAFLLALLAAPLAAVDAPPAARVLASTNSPVRQVGPGLYQIGGVRLDSRTKTITFAAALNLNEGLVEYVLVGNDGKIHESVLRTDIEPYHLHLAFVLLGARGTPRGALIEDYSKPLPGDAVTITATWTHAGRHVTRPVEDFVRHITTQTVLKRGDWTHTGSRTIEGTFLAQRDRSFIAVRGDVDALINNPRPGRDNDKIWEANPLLCPPKETPVTVTVKLKLNPKPAGPSETPAP